MKPKIHPKYYQKAIVTCSCGNVFKVGSTMEKMEIEICSACHPFYTGKKKLVDSAGQVDRFQKKMEIAKKFKEEKEAKIKAKKATTKKAKVKKPTKKATKKSAKKKITKKTTKK